MSGSFTEAVKQELARTALPAPAAGGTAELAWTLRCGGALVRSGAPLRSSLVLETTSGAAARRAFALLHDGHGRRPALQVRAAGGVRRRTTFALRVEDDADTLARELGLLDRSGLPATPRADGPHPDAAVRGALLAAGSVTDPGREPHLEIACHDGGSAAVLATIAAQVVAGRFTVVDADGRRPRVVVKSGATIAALLARLGAGVAATRWSEHRDRRRLRADATRLANADGANLARSVRAAARQVEAVERLVAAHGWDGLEEELRGLALARLTSPEASLAELGLLTDPPLSRTTVHRRLARLVEQAAELQERSPGDPSAPGRGRSSGDGGHPTELPQDRWAGPVDGGGHPDGG